MKTINTPQGSPEWLAHRTNTYNASDAAAAVGCSPYKTRTQLLDELVTGITPEHDAATERRFADGHRFEALARPLAEQIIGDDLYPVTGTEDTPSFSRALGASFDGLTLMNDTAFEHKTLNERLRYDWDEGNGDHLPKDYRLQMEQQMLVSGAERVLFMATRWAGDECVERKHCWYSSDAALRAELLAAWRQIDADRASHVPATAVEKVVAEPVEALPAPVVQVTGQIALQDNFKVFEQRLRDFLENKLIRQPKTDQDFADLDGQIKAMKQARESLKAAEAQMLAQVQPVDQAKKTKDMLDKLLQQNVSMAEGLLSAEKDRRKGEIVAGGVAALKTHIDGLNTRLGKPYMPVIPADFGGMVRGLKSLTSMEDKVSGELARCKIAANEVADRIDANLKYLREHAKDHTALFPDTAQIVLKAQDDLQALATSRIAQHKEAEQRRLDAERQRIREEEQARADREARDRLAAEQGAQQATQAPAALPGVNAVSISNALNTGSIPRMGGAGLDTGSVPVAANVVPLSRPAAPAVDTGARVKLGDINAAIAPLSISADGLAQLGLTHVATEKSAKLYRLADLPAIYAAMVRHIEAVQAKQAA